RSGARNPDLFLNQGNANLLAGDLPGAILAYRRGLEIAPNDIELRNNLAHARQQVAFPPPGTLGRPPVEDRPPWLPRWPGLLFALTLLGWLVTCVSAARWVMVRKRWLLISGSVSLGVAVICGLGLLMEDRDLQHNTSQPLAVI